MASKKSSEIVTLRYVGPHDEIVIAETGATCGRNGTVDVAAWVAGSAPAGDHPGSGLLAQTSNWQPAASVPEPIEADAPSDNPEE